QHGLADTTEAGKDEGAFGATAGHPFEHHLEHLQLAVAAGQLGWPLPGSRRVRVANRIHDRTVSAYLVLPLDARRTNSTRAEPATPSRLVFLDLPPSSFSTRFG